MSQSSRCGRLRKTIGYAVPSGSGWRRGPPNRRECIAADRSWPSVLLPVSTADDVAVTFTVPGGGSDTSGAKNIFADRPDNGFRQLADNLDITRHRKIRHPGTAKIQQLCVIQVAVRLHGDEQQDVILTQVAGHADHRGLEHRR